MSLGNKIPNGWVEKTLGEVLSSANTGLDAIKRAPIVVEETGIKCFRIQDASQKKGYKRWGNTKVEDKNYQKFKLVKGDILIARTGNTIGVNHLVKEDMKSVFNNGLIRLRVNDKCNYIFLYKIIESKLFYRYVQSIAYGTSTQPNMKINVLLAFGLLLPPLPEQKAIANILTAFDDKIENLQAQNQTLEKTAQTIFKEWFGKYQINDELPEGWRVGKLGEEFDITIGRTPPRKEPVWFSKKPTGKKWISIKDIGNSGLYIDNTSEYLTDEAIVKFNIPIIPKNTTILSFKMTVGKLTITTENMLSNEAIAHLKLKEDSFITSEFIYLYLQNLDFNALGSTSSIVTAINSTIIKNLDFIIPKKETLNKFDKVCISIFNKIRNNSQKIQSLKKTRDSLLPKLMSGQIRVKEFKS